MTERILTVENIKDHMSYFALPRIPYDTLRKWNCTQQSDSPVLTAGFNKQKVKETSKLSQNWLWEIVDFNKEKVQETSRNSRKCHLLLQRYKAMATWLMFRVFFEAHALSMTRGIWHLHPTCGGGTGDGASRWSQPLEIAGNSGGGDQLPRHQQWPKTTTGH